MSGRYSLSDILFVAIYANDPPVLKATYYSGHYNMQYISIATNIVSKINIHQDERKSFYGNSYTNGNNIQYVICDSVLYLTVVKPSFDHRWSFQLIRSIQNQYVKYLCTLSIDTRESQVCSIKVSEILQDCIATFEPEYISQLHLGYQPINNIKYTINNEKQPILASSIKLDTCVDTNTGCIKQQKNKKTLCVLAIVLFAFLFILFAVVIIIIPILMISV